MKQINKTAKTMEKVLQILEIVVKIGFVGTIIGLAVIAVALVFNLDPYLVGNDYGSLELGTLELNIAESAIDDNRLLFLPAAIEILIGLIITVWMLRAIRCIRSIVQPMMDGSPFFQGVGDKIKNLAKYCFILGIKVNILRMISTTLIIICFDLETLLTNDIITAVTINAPLDGTFLLTGAVLLLLSYIFRHGEQLQQLSDETL